MTDILADDLHFTGGEGTRGFVIHELVGLTGGVGISAESTQRPASHGEFDLPGYLSARLPSWSGFCLADSPEEMGQYGIQLSGFLAGGATRPVTFMMPGRTVWGMARLLDETPTLETVVWGTISKYSVHLRMPDPRLYGETRVFTTGQAAFHRGNFPAAPVFTVTGSSATGYTINGPEGRKYVVTRALVSGTPHVIDMRTGFLEIGGSPVVGGVSQANTWGINGGAQFTHSISGGSAVLSTALTDTFM